MALFGACIAMALAGAALAAWWAWRWVDEPLPLSAARAEVTVEAGASARTVAQSWVDAGLKAPPRLLYEWFRWSGQARAIRAGTYEITQSVTPRRPGKYTVAIVRGETELRSFELTVR